MPLLTYAQQTGVFGSADLELLSRVYTQAVSNVDDEQERTIRARVTISLFRSGVSDEATLLRMVSANVEGSPLGERPDHLDEDDLTASIWAKEMLR